MIIVSRVARITSPLAKEKSRAIRPDRAGLDRPGGARHLVRREFQCTDEADHPGLADQGMIPQRQPELLHVGADVVADALDELLLAHQRMLAIAAAQAAGWPE